MNCCGLAPWAPIGQLHGLGTQEATLRAGDVLILRATNHASANRSDAVARMAFILIDAA